MKHIYIGISPYNDIRQLPEYKASLVNELSHGCIISPAPEDMGLMEHGSVYFDMSDTPLPQRNHIYPALISKGIQIVSLINEYMTSAVNMPWTVNEVELMHCMDYLSAAMKYSCGVVYENETAQKAFSLLCEKAQVSCPECIALNQIPSLSKEAGTVKAGSIKQMVVLTARNEDIMRSLPFIEAYMLFIEELVVCCPERNVEPFVENYTGRLSLTFITDDELLKGRVLPSDHQARNFFLRCMLMEQDVLDDVFIMTDDDYRPMKPVTEETFIKDGRYQAYYFYDIRKWQGTYNNYTSFDKGAFRTRDFLLENGYDTLQYSSHQPQVIDRNIFREMLMLHKGIENNPYDEWSTYFNFGLYHHPDKFRPRRNISMCWPADTASWDMYHEPDEFMFENFYQELYDKGGIFQGFSQEFDVHTEKENTAKTEIFRKLVKKHMSEQEVFRSYCREYSDRTAAYPEMIIDFEGTLTVGIPVYMQLPCDCWTRIPVRISSEVYRAYEGRQLFVSYHFLNSMEVPVLNSPAIQINTGDTRLMLPVRSPKDGSVSTGFMIKAVIKSSTDGRTEAAAQAVTDLKLIQEK